MFSENENKEFLNKKIIVTGASSGIGLSVALYFLNCGAQVILAARDMQSMKRLCIDFKFPNAIIMKLDLASEDTYFIDFKASVIERFKAKIDILINCAGIKLYGDVENTWPQDFDFILDVNLRSVYYLIYSLAPYINRNGSIINMSCLYGSLPMYGMLSYSVSKAGLEGLTRYAAAELSSIGIRVNAISACPVKTNSFGYLNLKESDIEYFNKNMEKNIPLGRIGMPDDITKVIVFLASEKSKKITGQIIKVDGGRALTSSGYIHYKGIQNMNCRFEPDAEKVVSWAQNLFDFKAKEAPENEEELKKYIEEKIGNSNFSKEKDEEIFCSFKNE